MLKAFASNIAAGDVLLKSAAGGRSSSAALLKARSAAPQSAVGGCSSRAALLKAVRPLLFGPLILLLLIASLPGNLWAQSFRAAASAGVTSGTTSLTINKPTGTASGDVMIAAIAVRPNTATISAAIRLDSHTTHRPGFDQRQFPGDLSKGRRRQRAGKLYLDPG